VDIEAEIALIQITGKKSMTAIQIKDFLKELAVKQRRTEK
jgi:hypothetical protein